MAVIGKKDVLCYDTRIDSLPSGGHVEDTYGAFYFSSKDKNIYEAKSDNHYYYKTYIGSHRVDIERGDCAFWISADGQSASISRGPGYIDSSVCATVIRGFMPENKTCEISQQTTLPYINGCSTKQIFPPDRLGDPTLQLLYMPPFTAEQSHHIHSTVRVVYVQSGRGYSIVGMSGQNTETELNQGDVIVLEPMCPHHFRTEEQGLRVVPLHVFSSVGNQELSHPMFNGTHRT